MKFFLLLICTSVALAQPTIKEIDEYLSGFDCAVDVIEKVIDNGKLKAESDHLSSTVKAFIGKDRTKCHAAEEEDEVHKCLMNLVVKVLQEFFEFGKIVREKDPKLDAKLSKKIKAHCPSMSTISSIFSGNISSLMEKSGLDKNRDPKYFQCLADAMGEAWIANGEEKVWSEFQPNLQLHLDNWKKCADAEDVDKCNTTESRAINKIMNEIVITMNLTNPQVFLDFARISREKCGKI